MVDLNEYPDWDGTFETAPKIGQSFSYKGIAYDMTICDCGNLACMRPMAVRANTLDEVMFLTILARGENQGRSQVVILIKMGRTYKEIAELVEQGIPVRVMFEKFLNDMEDEIRTTQDIGAFLEKHGIPDIMLADAMGFGDIFEILLGL